MDRPTQMHRRYWDAEAASYHAEHGAAIARAPEAWGVWRVPERELGALGDVAGATVLELGCGGGALAWALQARGARVVGLDVSLAMLRTAARPRRRRASPGWVQAAADALPVPDASVDIVCSDHGAIGACHLDLAVPEAARVLRPGGRLVFCLSSPTRLACTDEAWEVTTRLARPMFGASIVTDGTTVDHVPMHGEVIATLAANGLVVQALHELRPGPRTRTTYEWWAPHAWARQWPSEDLWVAQRVRQGA